MQGCVDISVHYDLQTAAVTSALLTIVIISGSAVSAVPPAILMTKLLLAPSSLDLGVSAKESRFEDKWRALRTIAPQPFGLIILYATNHHGLALPNNT